jgi:hypothetical protein
MNQKISMLFSVSTHVVHLRNVFKTKRSRGQSFFLFYFSIFDDFRLQTRNSFGLIDCTFLTSKVSMFLTSPHAQTPKNTSEHGSNHPGRCAARVADGG